MALISFPTDTFNHFKNCPADLLEEEIARANIRLKLHNSPQTDAERRQYQEALDRVTVLKYISQLRKGKLSREDFDLKVGLNN